MDAEMTTPYLDRTGYDLRDTDIATVLSADQLAATFLDEFFALDLTTQARVYRDATDDERELIDGVRRVETALVLAAVDEIADGARAASSRAA